MKTILFLVLAFLASPAFADKIDSSSWNTVTGQLNFVTHQNGAKAVSQFYGPTVLTGTVSIGTSGSGGATGPSSYTTALSDPSYFQSQTTSGSGSSATVTITLKKIGFYRVEVMSATSSSSTGPTECFERVIFAGSASSFEALNTVSNEMSNAGQQDCALMSTALYQVKSVPQTITVNPFCQQTFSAGTHTCFQTIRIFPL